MDQDKTTTALLEKSDTAEKNTEVTATEMALVNRPPKDIWDKIGALAPIISGVMIFIMGGYFTYSYNQQQLRLQEIQTIEKFIPHLMGNDQSKRAAILAISSLTNAELAGKFAQIFASKGTVSALQSLAENGTESDKNYASSALAKSLENLAARESKLNQMETTFQQALNEKSGQSAPVADGGDQIDEANRLEHLAEMSRNRGQTSVAESLLKQAVNIRIRVQLSSDAREVVASLKKLADIQQAAGSKEDAENTLKKISLIETKFNLTAGGTSPTSGSAALPPPAPPPHEASAQTSKPAGKGGEENATTRDQSHEPAAEGEVKVDSNQPTGESESSQPKAAPEAESR